jgi:hypothetical protein
MSIRGSCTAPCIFYVSGSGELFGENVCRFGSALRMGVLRSVLTIAVRIMSRLGQLEEGRKVGPKQSGGRGGLEHCATDSLISWVSRWARHLSRNPWREALSRLATQYERSKDKARSAGGQKLAGKEYGAKPLP